MIVGPENLEMKVVEQKTHRGTRRQRFIDYKDGIESPFIIGHTQKSETFYPTFSDQSKQSFNFLDVAGLHDTGGQFLEFVNQLIIKKIFNLSETVRFLVPITDKQIEDSRGTGLI